MLRPETRRAIEVVALLGLLGPAALAAAPRLRAQDTPPNLSGVWQGRLTHIPARPGAAPVDITVEIGQPPEADSSCVPWRTVYAEGGTVRQVKDDRFCRGSGAEDLYLDVGEGARLPARWIGTVLYLSFKVGDVLVVSSVRLRGVLLEEEILNVQDRPAAHGIQPLVPRSIQRLVLRRRPI